MPGQRVGCKALAYSLLPVLDCLHIHLNPHGLLGGYSGSPVSQVLDNEALHCASALHFAALLSLMGCTRHAGFPCAPGEAIQYFTAVDLRLKSRPTPPSECDQHFCSWDYSTGESHAGGKQRQKLGSHPSLHLRESAASSSTGATSGPWPLLSSTSLRLPMPAAGTSSCRHSSRDLATAKASTKSPPATLAAIQSADLVKLRQ